MAKYIDADLLITHINQRIKEHNKSIRQNKRTTKSDIVDSMLTSSRDAYEALLHFIKKNQPERPDVDLEREIRDFFSKWDYDCYKGVITMDGGVAATLSNIIDVARHFYELGIKAGKEE